MKKIAYCIMVHNDIVHLTHLISALGHQCEIFIHVDGFINDTPFLKALKQFKNVHFLSPRIRVSWGGISMVDVMIELLRIAIDFPENFSHFVFLSGSCYPIKPAKTIQEFFLANQNKSFIKFIKLTDHPDYEKQVKYQYIMENPFKNRNKLTHQLHRVLRRASIHARVKNKWQREIVPYGGSNWVALNKECADYVIKYHDNNPWFYQMFKNTYAPDEHYIHTILGNSPLVSQCTGIQVFQYFGLDYLANLHIVHISLTKWFTIADWDEIKNSDKFFVRKVRTSDGKDLVERIDQEILHIDENS